MAFDVIGSFAFGAPFGFIDAGEDFCDLIRTIDIRGEVLNALGVLPTWLRPWMKYNFFDKFWSEGLRATSNLGKIGQEAFARRTVLSGSREDLLSYLLAGKNEQNKEPLTDEEIIAESISFIVGGSDTTSSTMTNIFDFIARDDAIQQRLVDEIDSTFPGKMEADWVPPNSDLVNMPFLNAVMREVMRVRPTSSTGLERVIPPGGKVIAGTFIPGGVSCKSSYPCSSPLKLTRT
jgi:benzoate 4-monooxygenase